MKKTLVSVLTVILLVGGIVLFGGGERPQPELASTQVIQQA